MIRQRKKRRLLFSFLLCACTGAYALDTESADGAVPASVDQQQLLQRFSNPKALSYRAEIELGTIDNKSRPSVKRVLVVQNGVLSLAAPALGSMQGAQITASEQSIATSELLTSYQAQWEEIAAEGKASSAFESIADRVTKRLRFLPRDGWRYTRLLWLDEATGLPLKTEIYRKGELIERVQVNHIRFVQADPPIAAAVNAPMQSMFSVRNQPKGFSLTAVRRDGSHVQQIYSDGLARVSVFVQSIGHLPAVGYTQRGSTGFVVRRNGSVDLIAVGDVPQATLERFLGGVEVVEQ